MRRIVLGGLVLLACLVTVWGTVVYVLDHDRRSAERELAQDRLQSLAGAARALGIDLEGIGKDLALAGTLTASAATADSAQRELHAITAVRRQNVFIEVRPDGGPAIRVSTGEVPAQILALAQPVIEQMVEAARREPGELQISPGLSSADDLAAWYRVFASRPRGAHVTVASVIDMRLVVAPPDVLRVGPSRLLLVSAHGVPAPASDAAITAALRAEAADGQLHQLVARARARWSGTATLDAATARRLGLPDATAVAAAVPIPIDAGAPWVLMLVTSSSTLDARHEALVRRIALDLSLGLLLLAAASAYVVRNARRSARLQERLRNAELFAHLTEKAEKILDHVPSGVLALDGDGTVSACNRSFGAQREDIVGRPFAEVFGTAPAEHVRVVVELAAAARAAGEPRTVRRAPLALHGTDSYFTIHAIPLANTFRDVSMLLVLDDESRLQRAEDRLLRSEKLATAGQLAAGIAHEIGTPLAVARGRAEMILLRGSVDESDARNVRTITEQIDYVSRLIEQLLDYLRPHRAQVQSVDASRTLQLVADLVEPAAASRGVKLEISSDADAGSVSADPAHLQQVLVNLVMNAIDACSRGGYVTLRARRRSGAVELEVTDDGRGIALEHRAHVFDPFFTTKKRGQGTGLGLWVVAQVVRAHDAEIEVDSQPGVGSTFRIVWPAAGHLA